MQIIFNSGIIFFMLLIHTFLNACSCGTLDLKGICESEEEAVIIKCEFIQQINHGEGYHSIYVKVDKVLKGEHLLSDTIELVGGTNDASCEPSFSYLREVKTFYLAFLDFNHLSVPSDKIPMADLRYKRFSPSLCSWLWLKYDENVVSGPISVSDVIYRYPTDEFEEGVIQCNFSQEVILKYFCPGLEIFPNPLEWDYLRIDGDLSLTHAVDAVNIYNLNGERIYTSKYTFTSQWFNYSDWRIQDTPAGIFIVEIICGENRIVKKVGLGF